MCGLVAFIGKNLHGFNKDQVDAFDQLLYVDALRGRDSTGMFLVDKEGTMELAKEASSADVFRQHKDYEELLTRAVRNGSALVGHNRAATRGTIIDANAHPFVVDDRITLVHNGTLFNHKNLADVEVDSHAIAHTIHEAGDDVQAAMQQIDGAYALIWHDHKNKTLNFLRNSQRPLNWIETERGWIWASEQSMIAFILNRFDFKPKGSITALPEGHLMTYTQSNSGWAIQTKKIELVAPKKYQQQGYQRNTFQGWPGGTVDDEWDEGEAYCTVPKANHGNVLLLPTKPPMQQQNASIVSAIKRDYVENGQYGAHPKVVKAEMEIANSRKMDVSAERFHNETYDIKDGTFQAGTCFDFIPVNGKNEELGYFLYAELEPQDPTDAKILMRCFVEPNVGDYEILDWTLNNRKVLMNIRSRQWRAYHDAAMGKGYGCLLGGSYRMIAEAVDTEDSILGGM